jgi:FkbM family methyltransferase
MRLKQYTNPHWWALRAHQALEGRIPDKFLMEAIGRTSRYSPEPEVMSLPSLVDKEKIAVDVGAAYGLYSWNLARICRRCVAFEANPVSASRLMRGLPTVEVHSCALSSHEGTAVLRVPRDGRVALTGFATLESRFKSSFDQWYEYVVPTKTLDSFGLQDVGFIKMDIEGHELSALKGAEQTIQRDRPLLLLEFDSQGVHQEVQPILTWLDDMGYIAHPLPSRSNALFVPL